MFPPKRDDAWYVAPSFSMSYYCAYIVTEIQLFHNYDEVGNLYVHPRLIINKNFPICLSSL